MAMAPSGETVIVRDRSGRVWLHPPQGAGRPEVIDEALAQRAVADHGFERIDRSFQSWEQLDRFRQERASRLNPKVVVNRDALDLEDVERLTAVGRRWVAEGQGARARGLVVELLRLPAVRADGEAHDRLLAFLEELAQPRLSVVSKPLTRRQAAARERWNRRDVAA